MAVVGVGLVVRYFCFVCCCRRSKRRRGKMHKRADVSEVDKLDHVRMEPLLKREAPPIQ